MYTDETRVLSDIPATNKSAETQAIVSEYYSLIDAAKAVDGNNEAARFEAFAAAEAFLLDHAIVIPMRASTDGYVADMRDPFDRQYTAFGLPKHRMKGRQLMDEPMSSEEYFAAQETWEQERADALAAAQ